MIEYFYSKYRHILKFIIILKASQKMTNACDQRNKASLIKKQDL